MSSQGTWEYDSADGDTRIQPALRPQPPAMAPPTPVRPAPAPAPPPARESEEFGGMRFGACFFGYLVASAMLVVLGTLTAVVGLLTLDGGPTLAGLAAAGAALASPAAAAVALGLLLLAYLCGGYVAGRMARFSGLAQGFGVWLWAVVMAVLGAVAGLILSSSLIGNTGLGAAPPNPLNPWPQLASMIGLGLVAVVSLVGALLGGLLGMRYHRRIDRAGLAR